MLTFVEISVNKYRITDPSNSAVDTHTYTHTHTCDNSVIELFMCSHKRGHARMVERVWYRATLIRGKLDGVD
jgi:hypothetical protein